MLNWKPNKSKSTPLYIQIKEYIIQLIKDDVLRSGDKLPTQNAMAKAYDVNRSTIVLALDDLKADGFIDSKTKGGTIVLNNTWALMLDKPQFDWQNYSHAGTYQSSLEVAKLIFENEFSDDYVRIGAGELSEHIVDKSIVDELTQAMSKKINRLSYCHPQGLEELRYEIIKYYKRFNITISPQEIMIVNGISQSYHLIALGILNKNATALAEKTSYITSLKTLQSSGINVYGVPMDKLGIIPNKLRSAKIKSKASILFANPFFQNPTGTLMSPARAKQLVEVCSEEHLPIVEDDTYRELYFGKDCPNPLLCYDDSKLVMHLGSLSKTLFPGLRLGWIIANPSIIKRLTDIKAQTDISSSIYDQTAALELFRTGLFDKYLNIVRQKLYENCMFTHDLLERYFRDIAEWDTPTGGYYYWITIKKEISIKKVFHECFKRKVLITPGFLYHYTATKQIRISFSYASKSELEYGLKTLSDVIKEM